MQSTLSPKELASAVGVSESSLKRWADEGKVRVSRTAGGHRRIALGGAVRFIRESKLDLVRPEILGLAAAGDHHQAIHAEDVGALVDPLYRFLHEGDIVQARSLVISSFLDGRPLAALFDGPVRASMERLGELYQHSDEGIFIEHRATDICIHTLNQIRMMLPQPGPDAPVAVGGAPSGDPYVIPSLMASLVLAEQGYRAMNLGAQTPLDVLGRAAIAEQARLAWLSASSPVDRRWLQISVVGLADQLQANGVALAIGGRQIDPAASFNRDNVQVVPTMTELAAYARGLRSANAVGS